MKSICCFTIAIAVTASAVTSAQTSQRELTIQHIVDVAFNQANVYSAKSPSLNVFLDMHNLPILGLVLTLGRK